MKTIALILALITGSASAQELILMTDVHNVGGVDIQAIFNDVDTECALIGVVHGYKVHLKREKCIQHDNSVKSREVDIQFETVLFPMRAGERFNLDKIPHQSQ